MAAKTRLYIAIPLMNELENLDSLLDDLCAQTLQRFVAIFCVNQPDVWWYDAQKFEICQNNQKTIARLRKENRIDVVVIDRSSPGEGWTGKYYGVGWARKTAMDAASKLAGREDFMIAMDGDSHYPSDYLEKVQEAFGGNHGIKALSIPYFHRLNGRDPEDRAVLRYEIYMRYFAVNMLRINNPYAFTAIGSAMACTTNAYRDIRGITPHKSGEDFYFIQKLRKYGPVKIDADTTAFPAARFSDRVFFGTGPAMIRGNSGDWSGYPVYPYELFDEVKITFDQFKDLYTDDVELPMSEFLYEKFGKNLWDELRRNARSISSFERACRHRVDGLRILQYLKWRHNQFNSGDEENLKAFLNQFYPDETVTKSLKDFSDFGNTAVEQLDFIRYLLFENETRWRKKISVLRG